MDDFIFVTDQDPDDLSRENEDLRQENENLNQKLRNALQKKEKLEAELSHKTQIIRSLQSMTSKPDVSKESVLRRTMDRLQMNLNVTQTRLEVSEENLHNTKKIVKQRIEDTEDQLQHVLRSLTQMQAVAITKDRQTKDKMNALEDEVARLTKINERVGRRNRALLRAMRLYTIMEIRRRKDQNDKPCI
jgi:hypothetical protein